MHWRLWRIGGMLVLSAGLGIGHLFAGTMLSAQDRGENGIIMVKQQPAVWLQCQFEAGPGAEVPGFCARLLADFTRQSGRIVNPEPIAPDGAQVLIVSIAPRDGYRAAVVLTVGWQVQGQFVPAGTQHMRLGSMDAPLRAGSAAALVYPLVGLLETLR